MSASKKNAFKHGDSDAFPGKHCVVAITVYQAEIEPSNACFGHLARYQKRQTSKKASLKTIWCERKLASLRNAGWAAILGSEKTLLRSDRNRFKYFHKSSKARNENCSFSSSSKRVMVIVKIPSLQGAMHTTTIKHHN
eukprot:2054632-Amphidinium_carterae.1